MDSVHCRSSIWIHAWCWPFAHNAQDADTVKQPTAHLRGPCRVLPVRRPQRSHLEQLGDRRVPLLSRCLPGAFITIQADA